MTFRRLSALIEHLPSESATKTFQRNQFSDAELADMAGGRDEHGAWSHTDLILAHISDLIGWLIFAQGDGKGQKPQPYPRPGITTPDGRRPGRMGRDAMDFYLRHRRIGTD